MTHHIAVVGGPGSGKSVFLGILEKEFPHLGVKVNSTSALAKTYAPEVVPVMQNGDFVDDDIILDLIRNRGHKKGVVGNDGAPRTVVQASEMYEGVYPEAKHYIVMLYADEDVCQHRCLVLRSEQRRKEGQEVRPDDDERIFKNRIRHHKAHWTHVCRFWQKLGSKVVRFPVDASQPLPVVEAKHRKILRQISLDLTLYQNNLALHQVASPHTQRM